MMKIIHLCKMMTDRNHKLFTGHNRPCWCPESNKRILQIICVKETQHIKSRTYATFSRSVDPNLSFTRVAICLSCCQKKGNRTDDDADYRSLIQSIYRLQQLEVQKWKRKWQLLSPFRQGKTFCNFKGAISIWLFGPCTSSDSSYIAIVKCECTRILRN